MVNVDSLVSVALSRDSLNVFPVQFDTVTRKSDKKSRFVSISDETASISSYTPSEKNVKPNLVIDPVTSA